MRFDDLRALFPITRESHFFNHAGFTPFNSLVASAAVRAARVWQTGSGSDQYWLEALPASVRALFAHLIRSSPSSISFTTSTAHGLSLLASGLDWRPGDNVVGAQWEFPANIIPWLNLQSRGVAYRQVPLSNGRIEIERLAAAIDDRTKVVALSHVQFWNGWRADLETIGTLCRERRVILAVDGIQSLGALDVDVSTLPVDFISAGAYKWLMGPNGFGFCYWHPDLFDRVQPILFDDPVAPSGPERVWQEPRIPSFASLACAETCLKILLALGSHRIEARVLGLAAELAERLEPFGCQFAPPWPRLDHERSGIVSVALGGVEASVLQRALDEAGVIARTHNGYARLAVHCWNTPHDIEAAVNAVHSAARRA